ncbi:MAG: hypothetical protein ILP02_03955, partial [Clostridia bacterium]|nr:hypothetical protein [Clostridia bacterium]
MKKIIVFLVAALVVMSCAACRFVSSPKADAEGKFYVYVGEDAPAVYEVTLDEIEVTEGAFSVLNYLKRTQGLFFEYSDSEYGAFLTAVGDMRAEGNLFIALYTTVDEDKNVPGPYTTEKVVSGRTFVTSGV